VLQARVTSRVIVHRIVAATGPTYSCQQREYLGFTERLAPKSAHSGYSKMILIEVREGQFFLDGVARVLQGHVLHFSDE
jgi:hypothetical protein